MHPHCHSADPRSTTLLMDPFPHPPQLYPSPFQLFFSPNPRSTLLMDSPSPMLHNFTFLQKLYLRKKAYSTVLMKPLSPHALQLYCPICSTNLLVKTRGSNLTHAPRSTTILMVPLPLCSTVSPSPLCLNVVMTHFLAQKLYSWTPTPSPIRHNFTYPSQQLYS